MSRDRVANFQTYKKVQDHLGFYIHICKSQSKVNEMCCEILEASVALLKLD